MIRRLILTSGDKNYNIIKVKREKQVLDFKVKPIINPDTGASLIGIQFYMNNKISELIDKDPAQKAGLKKGDEIIKIDNQNMHDFSDIKAYVSKKPNQILNILINRNNKQITVLLKTKAIKNTGFLGVVLDSPMITYLHKSKNIFSAISDAFQQTIEVVKNIIYSLETMFSGKIKVSKAVAGHPRIIYMLGELAQKAEFMGYFRFIAFISIALGVFNLLPYSCCRWFLYFHFFV